MSLVLNGLSDLRVVELLADGAVGVMPTDTVYGLVCSATNESAVARLYKLKSRENKPGTIIAADAGQLIELGIRGRYLKAVESYWPGAVSVIIPSHGLQYIHLGLGGIAIRLPAIKEVHELLTKTGPLLTTSANHPGLEPAHSLAAAQEYFGERVDFYVEGGDLSGHKPSTLIRIVDDAVEVLRPGAITIDENTGRIIK